MIVRYSPNKTVLEVLFWEKNSADEEDSNITYTIHLAELIADVISNDFFAARQKRNEKTRIIITYESVCADTQILKTSSIRLYIGRNI
jgi:hypothetical protein